MFCSVCGILRLEHETTKENLAVGTNCNKRKCKCRIRFPFVCFRNIRQRRRVYDIVSFLPLGDLEVLKRHWVKGGATGVTKELFLENMLRVSFAAAACKYGARTPSSACVLYCSPRHV